MRKKSNKFKDKLANINRDRSRIGLKKLKIKLKTCSKCGDRFETITHDICCPTCRRNNNQYFLFYGAYGDESE